MYLDSLLIALRALTALLHHMYRCIITQEEATRCIHVKAGFNGIGLTSGTHALLITRLSVLCSRRRGDLFK